MIIEFRKDFIFCLKKIQIFLICFIVVPFIPAGCTSSTMNQVDYRVVDYIQKKGDIEILMVGVHGYYAKSGTLFSYERIHNTSFVTTKVDLLYSKHDVQSLTAKTSLIFNKIGEFKETSEAIFLHPSKDKTILIGIKRGVTCEEYPGECKEIIYPEDELKSIFKRHYERSVELNGVKFGLVIPISPPDVVKGFQKSKGSLSESYFEIPFKVVGSSEDFKLELFIEEDK